MGKPVGVALISIPRPWARSVDELHVLSEIGASVSQTCGLLRNIDQHVPQSSGCVCLSQARKKEEG